MSMIKKCLRAQSYVFDLMQHMPSSLIPLILSTISVRSNEPRQPIFFLKAYVGKKGRYQKKDT